MTPFNRSSQIRFGAQLRLRPITSTAPPQEDDEEEGPPEVGADQLGTSRRRRRTEIGPVESNAVLETLNGVRSQIQKMGNSMQAGFASMERRMDMMAERHKHLANEMRQQHAFIRDQFQALNMRFPPPPPED